MQESINKQLVLSNHLLYLNLISNVIIHSKIDDKDKEILLLLLQDRDRNYIRINHNEQCFEHIKEYLELFRPLALPLEELVRVGGKQDGGYVMWRGGGGLATSSHAIALSLGVSEYSPWDLDMAQRGFKVLEYDASIEKSPYTHPNIIFHKKFISHIQDEDSIALNQVFQDHCFKEEEQNILQCDIENCEWDMLENMDIKDLARYFTQVIFEFHGLNPEENGGFIKRKAQLDRLNEYFIPIHTHFNNHGKIFYSKDRFFSTTVEVSYLRRDIAKDYLSYGYREEAGNLPNLDYPVYLPNPEIPIKF